MDEPGFNASCSTIEEHLNLFVDGELPFEAQPALFAHLSGCDGCRRLLEGLLRFQQVSRSEHLQVPPACDELFFKRLARVKVAQAKNANLSVDSLWQVKRSVSLRTAAVALIFMFSMGALLSAAPEQPVHAQSQRAPQPANESAEPVYVIYPGLTVEDQR